MPKSLHFKQTLRGTVLLPASKSLANRALVIARCTGRRASIGNLSEADDTRILAAALADGGAANAAGSATATEDGYLLKDLGAAGTAMRFSTAYFATQPGRYLLTGTERMKQRPISILVDALRKLGANIEYAGREGFPPLRIKGHALQGGALNLPADVSSQYISALLMIAPTLAGGLRLTLEGAVASRPYIDMTLALMRRFGLHADWESGQDIRVAESSTASDETADFLHYDVESDWSGASYWYAMTALSPDTGARLVLPGLDKCSLQGDSRLRELFRPLGVETQFADGTAILTKCPPTSEPVEADLSQQPDLAQTLVVTCAMLRRPFRFTGLRSLRIKETDRIAALQNELRKLGVEAVAEGDNALRADHYDETAEAAKTGAFIDTYDDHRMAMSFAPCAYRYPGIRIAHPEVVSKSYPRFWEQIGQFEL